MWVALNESQSNVILVSFWVIARLFITKPSNLWWRPRLQAAKAWRWHQEDAILTAYHSLWGFAESSEVVNCKNKSINAAWVSPVAIILWVLPLIKGNTFMKGIWLYYSQIHKPRVQFCTHRQMLSKIHPSVLYAHLSLVKRELLPISKGVHPG